MNFIIEIMVAVLFTGAVTMFVMSKINEKDSEDLWEDSEKGIILIEDQKYNGVAVSLLHNGNNYQKECIEWYIQNTTGETRLWGIKRFIDVQLQLGKIEGYTLSFFFFAFNT